MGKTKFELPLRPDTLIKIEQRRSRLGRERRALEAQMAELSDRVTRDTLPSRGELERRAESVGRELRTLRHMIDELDAALVDRDDVRLERRKAMVLDRYEKLRGEAAEIDEAIQQGRYRPEDAKERTATALASGELVELAPTDAPPQIENLQHRLEIVRLAERKSVQSLVAEREAYNHSICDALRPRHRAAAQRIYLALSELRAANAEELEVRQVVPGLQLTRASFPNVDDHIFQTWVAHCQRHGLLDGPEPDLIAAE